MKTKESLILSGPNMKADTPAEKKVLRGMIKRRGDGGSWKECPCGWFYKGDSCPDKKCKIAYPGGKRIVKTYAHVSDEEYYSQGEKLGLEGDALSSFAGWGYEIEFEVEVDMTSGETKIISCDGHKLQRK